MAAKGDEGIRGAHIDGEGTNDVLEEHRGTVAVEPRLLPREVPHRMSKQGRVPR